MKPKIKAYLVAITMYIIAALSCWLTSLIDKSTILNSGFVGSVFTFLVAIDYLKYKYSNNDGL